jgi:hypothetical protein
MDIRIDRLSAGCYLDWRSKPSGWLMPLSIHRLQSFGTNNKDGGCGMSWQNPSRLRTGTFPSFVHLGCRRLHNSKNLASWSNPIDAKVRSSARSVIYRPPAPRDLPVDDRHTQLMWLMLAVDPPMGPRCCWIWSSLPGILVLPKTIIISLY